jgi:hypothetical protein
MRFCHKLVRDKRGLATPAIIFMLLIVFLIVAAVWEYLRLHMIASGVRDAMQSAVVAVAADNFDDTYDGSREGYAGGYYRYGDSWEESLDMGDIYTRLDDLLGLRRSGTSHIKQVGERAEFILHGLTIEVINSPLAAGSAEIDDFEAKAEITLEVPLSFGWDSLPPMEVRLHSTAHFTPKF